MDELLAALVVERYTSPWWTSGPSPQATVDVLADDEFLCAQRRRAAAEDYARLGEDEGVT